LAFWRTDLLATPVLCLLGDRRGIALGADPLVLAVGQVSLDPVPVLDGPPHAPVEDLLERSPVRLDDPAPAKSRRDVREQGVDEFLLATPELVVVEICFHHSHPAIYIVADRSGRDAAVLGVDGPDPADGEAVPLVAVGHADRVFDHPREVRGVFQLLEGEVIADLVQQRLARQHPRRDAHSVLLGDLPDVLPDLP